MLVPPRMIQSGASCVLSPDALVFGVVLVCLLLISPRCSTALVLPLVPGRSSLERCRMVMVVPPRLAQSRGPCSFCFAVPRMIQSAASGHGVSKDSQSARGGDSSLLLCSGCFSLGRWR